MIEPVNAVSLWCNRIIRWAFYLLLILVPLILTPINYELFEYNKMMMTYALTVIIAGAWVIKMVSAREVKIAKTPLDIPIGLFVASQLISTLLSMDPHVSWFGYYSRFNGGMWSVLTYVILYYAFVSTMIPQQTSEKNQVFPFLKIALSTAVVVSLYGVLERLGIDKRIWVQDVQNRVFSTLGQPNWLGAYLVALAPVAMVFAWLSQITKHNNKDGIFSFVWNWKFVIWNLISILFFTVLLFTRSRSGLVGFAVADIILWIGLLLAAPDKRRLFPTFTLLHVSFALIVFFNGSNVAQIDKFTFNGIRETLSGKQAQQQPKPSVPAGPALETGGTESTTIRKYVWDAAVAAWRSSTKTFLIGTGTETFAFAFYQYRPAAHNLTSEWDFLYNKAHNEYLNYLTTTGIAGLGSYLLILGVFLVWFVRMVRSSKNDERSTVNLALFSGWLSVLVTNFFGFSVVIMQIFLFLFPALIFIQNQQFNWYARKLKAKFPGAFVYTAIALAGLILFAVLGVSWFADTLYAKSYQIARGGQYATAKTLIDEAIVLNPGEPVYHDERSTTLAALAVGALDQQQATVGGRLAQEALADNDRAIQISPQNVNFWKTRTKIYYSFSVYDPKFTQAAIEALTHAGQLSPNDPKILYNLAILNGRITENSQAIDLLKKAIQIKSNYRDAYYALYVFYTELKDPANARGVLETYLTTVDASDKQFTDILSKAK